MRFIHTADWHIGRKLNGFDLIEDQKAIFQQLVKIVQEAQVEAIVIAGDLYDRSLPSEEAVETVNRMLFELNRILGLPLLVISGNHDSATRLATGRDWFKSTQFYLNTQLSEAFKSITIGDTQFFLLPYFEPSMARSYFKNEELRTLNQIIPLVVKQMEEKFDPDKKHVLVGHFFAAGSTHTDSEILVNVGGLDSVALNDLEIFDYVALGHLHNHLAIKNEVVQYAGSLLKFSVSEAKQEKGVYLVDTQVGKRKFIPLTPMHDLQHLTKSFAELVATEFYHQISRQDYFAISLTDENVIPNAMARLREIYERIISLDRVNGVKVQHLRNSNAMNLDPLALLFEYYEEVTGHGLDEKQKKWAIETLNEIKEENK